MRMVDSMRTSNISSNALARLNKGKSVSVEVIEKIRLALKYAPDDIAKFANNGTKESTSR